MKKKLIKKYYLGGKNDTLDPSYVKSKFDDWKLRKDKKVVYKALDALNKLRTSQPSVSSQSSTTNTNQNSTVFGTKGNNYLQNNLNNDDKVILINKTKGTLTVGDKTYDVWTSKLGTRPKQRKGDNLTPEGEFKIKSKEDSSGWTSNDEDDKGNKIKRYAYGPYFLRLATPDYPDAGIGIHGSDKWHEIKGGTHGCIAFKDNNAFKKFVAELGNINDYTVKIVHG